MILGIIPARFASTRFPGKPLIDLGGRTMIERVYRRAKAAALLDEVVVATDDVRIFDAVKAFGGEVVMTSPEHPTGTDRCAEVAGYFPKTRIVVNIQGDEPFIRPEQIDLAARTLLHSPEGFGIATLVKRIDDFDALVSPNTAKVVFSPNTGALYFSRQPIPFIRGLEVEKWLAHHVFFKHIGMYAYRTEILQQLAQLPQTPLEKAESLEQLRWLENGFLIRVAETQWETQGIDTPEDLERLNPDFPED